MFKYYECFCLVFFPTWLWPLFVALDCIGGKSGWGLRSPVHELHECDFCCSEAGRILIDHCPVLTLNYPLLTTATAVDEKLDLKMLIMKCCVEIK